jgi:hypothetical protein
VQFSFVTFHILKLDGGGGGMVAIVKKSTGYQMNGGLRRLIRHSNILNSHSLPLFRPLGTLFKHLSQTTIGLHHNTLFTKDLSLIGPLRHESSA